MFIIEKYTHNIRLTRGNSAEIDTTPFVQETLAPLELQEGDKVIFTVKGTKRIYLQKVLTKDNYDEDKNLVLKINPADTINLEESPQYTYDLMLITKDNDVYTYMGEDETAPHFIILHANGDMNNVPQENTEDDNDTEGGEVTE